MAIWMPIDGVIDKVVLMMKKYIESWTTCDKE